MYVCNICHPWFNFNVCVYVQLAEKKEVSLLDLDDCKFDLSKIEAFDCFVIEWLFPKPYCLQTGSRSKNLINFPHREIDFL